MDNWLVIAIIIAAAALMIGNFSVVQKNAKTPLRKQSLNDLQETLPRSHKKAHKMPTIVSNEPIELKGKSDLAIEVDEIAKQSALKRN
ncbi:hypothetical protein [Colwellia hornerae]|uniref:DUF2897 family protein n=1 Tax=Colwellia hornerae TaxID=89402 RepID=A0A5C6QGS1_9GAMM|nr:hypothetical protein [Colwellia hornerae]TWX52803.1 hypothetical protein ESZ28_11220 [Colwellia hornerae]TWX59157.1 hypothetical protein ESZ26_10600 [Colwellia hornerae]TWX68184.1 hypothetical protein ESZ27_07535 [Colwellia hornerae]